MNDTVETKKPRAVWRGRLEFGMLSIPVELHTASGRSEVPFRLIHREDRAPVRLERVCSADGKTLEADEVARGVEVSPGRFALIDDEAIARAGEEQTHEAEVLEFVRRGDIDPMSFEKPYLLRPRRGGERAYAVLRAALEESAMVGIARIVFRRRAVLAALHPARDAIALTMLRPHEDLRDPSELAIAERNPKPFEVEMARQLIERMAARWVPGQYRDAYRDRLRALVEARMPRRRKGAATAGAGKARGGSQDLVTALRQSLGDVRTGQRVAVASRAAAQPRATKRATTKRGTKRAAAKRAAAKRTRRRA